MDFQSIRLGNALLPAPAFPPHSRYGLTKITTRLFLA